MARVLSDAGSPLAHPDSPCVSPTRRFNEEQKALIAAKKAVADYSWLPTCAYSDWVVPIAQERGSNPKGNANESRLTMFDVCGPATRTAMVGFFVTWIFLLAFQIGIWYTSTCENADSDTEAPVGKQFVETPPWLFASFVPVYMIVTFCEWKCFKDISIPLVQWVGQLKIIGMRVPFVIWLIYELGLTTLASTSRPSQSLFILQTMKTFQCEGGDDLAHFWRKGERILPTGDIFGIHSIVIVVVLAWALMWLEALWAMLYTIPIEKVGYEPRSMKDGYRVLMSLNPMQPTTFARKGEHDTAPVPCFHIWHADAVQYLAEPTAMHSLRAHYMDYSLERAQVAAEIDPAKEMRAFQIIGNEASRVVSRFGFQTLQMCCALEVHVALVAFDADRVGGAANLDVFRVIAPMICHILSAVLQVGDALGRLWTLYSFRAKINKLFAGTLGDEDAKRADHNSTKITSALVALITGILVYSCVLVDVALKFYSPILSKVPFPRAFPAMTL